MRVNLKGINRVRMRKADGTAVELHYAWRGKGAPCFWRSDSGVKVGSPAYVAAFSACAPQPAAGRFRSVILRYLEAAEFKRLAPRTQRDMRTSINHQKTGIDAKFGDGPIAVFEDARIRGVVLGWRDKIGGKVGDDRVRHIQRIVGWAYDRTLIRAHHLRGIPSVYQSSRADVIWTDDEIQTFIAGAPPHIGRILIAATGTGLRPGDLRTLGPEHVHPTPHGRRLVVWTAKRKRLASIPVTPEMGALIDASAPQGPFLRTEAGRPWSHENYLGDAVSKWRDRLGLRRDLRLYDARGTAATRLLEAGAELKEIATAMGWSLKQAGEVIERYAALHPSMSDGLLAKLERAEARTETAKSDAKRTGARKAK